jgi:hypothetical protein
VLRSVACRQIVLLLLSRFLLHQPVSQDLAHERAWDFIAEMYLARDLVRAEPVLAECADLIFRGSLPRAEHDVDAHFSAATRPGHAHGGHLTDGRVFVQHFLDIAGIYVPAPHRDQVTDAVNDAEIPLVVHQSQVTGM